MTVCQGELYIIDVSQSVDLDHPRALHFLREDIQHVNAFFRRAGVPTLTMKELFDFVLNATVVADTLDAEVQRLMDLAAKCVRQPALYKPLVCRIHLSCPIGTAANSVNLLFAA